MKKPMANLFLEFIHKTREHLELLVRSGVLDGFFCTAQRRDIRAVSLFNGEVHSKAPLQVNTPIELGVSLLLPNERSVGFTVESVSMDMFVRQLEFALTQAVRLEHRVQLRRQDKYPSIKLASEELFDLFSNGQLAETILRVLRKTDEHAAKIKHPRLMNREISVSFSHSDKIYFDSTGNFAQELAASSSVSCSFSLEDTSESHFDVFGSIPTDKEIQNIVDLAAKNLIQSGVRPLEKEAHLPVLLTHKAVIDLLDELVLPNLETRALIDKTGAWELDHVGQVVVKGLSVEDNPLLEGSPFSSLFDFEGTPTRSVKIVDRGLLVHPLMTSSLLEEIEELRPEWKGRFDLTGHAVSSISASFTNLQYRLDCPPVGDLSQESFIQIQNLTGMSLDPLTGQFALDADGAKVFEKGVLKYSTSLTLRGNFFQALIDEGTRMGATERHYNQWAPSLFIRTLSCVSKELAQTFEE